MVKEIVENICEFWIKNYLNLHENENRNYQSSVWRYKVYHQEDIKKPFMKLEQESFDEQEQVWIAEWEQPSAALPISVATAKVIFRFLHRRLEEQEKEGKEEKTTRFYKILRMRYESQRLVQEFDLKSIKESTDTEPMKDLLATEIHDINKLDNKQKINRFWSLDLERQLKQVCDTSLFNPSIQLTQIVASKSVVSQFLREETWLKGSDVYNNKKKRIDEETQEETEHNEIIGNSSQQQGQHQSKHQSKQQSKQQDELEKRLNAVAGHIPKKLLFKVQNQSTKNIEFFDRLEKLNKLAYK